MVKCPQDNTGDKFNEESSYIEILLKLKNNLPEINIKKGTNYQQGTNNLDINVYWRESDNIIFNKYREIEYQKIVNDIIKISIDDN